MMTQVFCLTLFAVSGLYTSVLGMIEKNNLKENEIPKNEKEKEDPFKNLLNLKTLSNFNNQPTFLDSLYLFSNAMISLLRMADKDTRMGVISYLTNTLNSSDQDVKSTTNKIELDVSSFANGNSQNMLLTTNGDQKNEKIENEIFANKTIAKEIPQYKAYNGDSVTYFKDAIDYLIGLLDKYSDQYDKSSDTNETLEVFKKWGTSLVSFVATENAIAACDIESTTSKGLVQKKCKMMQSCNGLSLLNPSVLVSDFSKLVKFVFEVTRNEKINECYKEIDEKIVEAQYKQVQKSEARSNKELEIISNNLKKSGNGFNDNNNDDNFSFNFNFGLNETTKK